MQAWTPDVVEELLFRQYIKHEDVTALLPPEPQAAEDAFTGRYEEATKLLLAYVRSGPATALAPQSVNTIGAAAAGGKSAAKGLSSRSPIPRAAPEAARPPSSARSPASRTASAAAAARPPPPPVVKRQRVEWPADVPVNAALKSTSRSKVAPLTSARVAAQSDVDPDLIFRQNAGDLPLELIFAAHKNALKSVAAVRNASGNWTTDTFSPGEEDLYKRESGFRHIGPSQCK